jgi:cell division protein FtsL
VEGRVSTDAMPRPARPRKAERAARWEAPQGDRAERRARRRALLGRAVLVCAVAGSLGSVVWRQTEGVARQRELAKLQNDISLAEAERVEWTNRIQELQTRARITRIAERRLGLHVARDDEVVLLPVPASSMEQGQ